MEPKAKLGCEGTAWSVARRRAAAMLAAVAVVAGGCANSGEKIAHRASEAYYAGNFKEAEALLEPLAKETDENFALMNARLGSCYLADHRLTDAEATFQKVYEVMNSVGTNGGGRTLGAVLVDEKLKIWKGEPFDRAMANFYLGATYYCEGDYNNARAAFENALFKLGDYDDKTDSVRKASVDSNFVVAKIMLAKCWQRLGRDDLANANFAEAAAASSAIAPLADPGLNKSSNVLLLVDYGYGPRKNADMVASVLVFQPTPQQAGWIGSPAVAVDGRQYDLRGTNVPPLDVLALAQDRRWQSIDTIRTVKSAVGSGLIAGGAVMGAKGLSEGGSRQRTDLIVAGSLLAAGALLKATSQADLRVWEMLPRTTFVLPLELSPGVHSITLQMPNGTTQTWENIVAPAPGSEKAYYFRPFRWVPGPFVYPSN